MPDRPSLHLSWDELACHDSVRTPYPLELRDTLGLNLGAAFELLRHECGDRPLTVLSGYRTGEYNDELKRRGLPAASRSQHILGTAFDVAMPSYFPTYGEFVAAAFRAREKRPELIKGIGVYPERRSLHLDIRGSVDLAVWTK